MFVGTQQSTAALCFLPRASLGSRLTIATVSRIECSADIPLFVFLAMSNRPTLVDKRELECQAVHRHDWH